MDTLDLERKKHPGQRASLDALCKRYQIDNSSRQLHGALLDAKLLAQVYLAMTGGQTSLFAGKREIFSQTLTAPVATKLEKPLPIINANAEELAAHEAFMKLLKQKKEAAT